MLAKLSVLLGFLIAVSLEQTPDCKEFPSIDGLCCVNLLKIVRNIEKRDCDIQRKPGDLQMQVEVSLEQAPDRKKDSPNIDDNICCSNLVKFASDFDEGNCVIEPKTGDNHWQAECNFAICIMKKKGYLLSDNKIDRAVLTKFVKQNMTDYAPNIEKHLEKCYTDTQISKCSPLSFFLCTANILLKECPSTLWEKTKECTVLKNHYNNCPNAVSFPNIME